MTTAIAAIDAILFLLLAFWSITLRQKETKLEKIRKELQYYTDSLIEQKGNTKKVWCVYRFSESDYNKPESRMIRDVKDRISASIGRRVVKEIGLEEIIEDGVLVGYKIEAEVK